MKNKQNAEVEFESKLNDLLLKIRELAESQFQYSLANNIPNGIAGINYENVAEHAIELGYVAGFNHHVKWDADKTIHAAHHLLEDCNCHDVARKIQVDAGYDDPAICYPNKRPE